MIIPCILLINFILKTRSQWRSCFFIFVISYLEGGWERLFSQCWCTIWRTSAWNVHVQFKAWNGKDSVLEDYKWLQRLRFSGGKKWMGIRLLVVSWMRENVMHWERSSLNMRACGVVGFRFVGLKMRKKVVLRYWALRAKLAIRESTLMVDNEGCNFPLITFNVKLLVHLCLSNLPSQWKIAKSACCKQICKRNDICSR